MIFGPFIVPPEPALARLRAAKGRGGMTACHATVASPEQEGAVAGTGNYEVLAGPGYGTPGEA